MKKVFLVVALALLIGGMAMAGKYDNNGRNGQDAPYCSDITDSSTCIPCTDSSQCLQQGIAGNYCCTTGDKVGMCVGNEDACYTDEIG